MGVFTAIGRAVTRLMRGSAKSWSGKEMETSLGADQLAALLVKRLDDKGIRALSSGGDTSATIKIGSMTVLLSKSEASARAEIIEDGRVLREGPVSENLLRWVVEKVQALEEDLLLRHYRAIIRGISSRNHRGVSMDLREHTPERYTVVFKYSGRKIITMDILAPNTCRLSYEIKGKADSMTFALERGSYAPVHRQLNKLLELLVKKRSGS